jgi:hypothetical protein
MYKMREKNHSIWGSVEIAKRLKKIPKYMKDRREYHKMNAMEPKQIVKKVNIMKLTF